RRPGSCKARDAGGAMRRMISLSFLAASMLSACAPRYRFDTLGQARLAAAGAPVASAAPIRAELPLGDAPGPRRLVHALLLRRAVGVAYVLACPGVEKHGVLGESFDAYRRRRLAEQQQQRRQEAGILGAVVGAATGGHVQGTATTSTPAGTATASAD